MVSQTNEKALETCIETALVKWAFYKPIATAKELAQELARVSRDMEQIIAAYEEATLNDYLKTLYESFKRELLPNLKVSSDNAKDYSFADIYAQTIAYGLFTARVFSHVQNPREDFNRQDAWAKLPETNPFLRQLFQGISEQPAEDLGDDLADKISEVFSILRAAQMDAILSDFRQKMNREDIVIRFYEDFLAAYKPEMRERRGVYYTPEPVVSYMVRSVDILLKEKFDKPLGLADPEVMILDPACGTGTFLLWIFQLIHQRFEENPEALTEGLEDKSWSGYVQERLLPRVFGFELLMAPYAICHLKLGLFLEETGYQFDSGKRLGVYLTNTLDDPVRKTEFLLDEFISNESIKALEVKQDKPVMVVVGNPPYSVSSENQGQWINDLLQDYKKDLKETKINLDDDFIKFMRFAQWRVTETKYGILAFVTNHTYLDGITHRMMRQSLLNSFDDIYLLDLHGNSKKREVSPDNSKDENVFDIQQGVAIGFFVKDKNLNNKEKRVNHFDAYGTRLIKHEFLFGSDIFSTSFKYLDRVFQKSCLGDFYFFAPKAFSYIDEYCKFSSVKEIFVKYSSGIKTHLDKVLVNESEDEISEKIRIFIDENWQNVPIKNAPRSSSLKKSILLKDAIEKNNQYNFKNYSYRVFDTQKTAYLTEAIEAGDHRFPVMRHILSGSIALVTTRQLSQDGFHHVFVSKNLTDMCLLSTFTKECSYCFPLYLYPDESCLILQAEKYSNFNKKFIEAMRLKLDRLPAPETIFHYIYAILHSPTYRTRYDEFLKIDFPRIPLTSNSQLFQTLSVYGDNLINLHLMESSSLENLITQFQDGDRTVDPGHPKYANGKVAINKRGAGFTGVPEEVWNFYIGGYQVCHKWLKDRKGRTLSDDDILHYQKIIVALQETIRIMQQIDEAIPSWPIE